MRYGYVREGVATPKVNEKELFYAERDKLLSFGVEKIIEDRFALSKRERVNLKKLITEELCNNDILYIVRLASLEDSLARAVMIMEEVFNKGAKIYLDGVGLITKDKDSEVYQLLCKIKEAVSDTAMAKSFEGKAIAKMKNRYNDGRPRIPKDLMDRAMEIAETKGINKAMDATGISRSSLMRERARRKNNK